MIRTLHNNPFVAQVCGIDSPDDIPHEATFSRFFKRLAARKYLHKVKDVSRRLSLAYQAATPGFAQRVAIDSTTLKGWVNGGKPNPSDKMARWSVKKNTHGKTEFVLGWKLHLMVDCETEFPIAASISPGNTSDVTRASFLLAEARENVARFYPRYVMADAGYSSKDLFALIKRQYRAEPIIHVNRGHKRLMVRYGYWENTVSWKALYSQRQAVERCFSRLKGQRSLNNITVRGSTKVKAHCYLSLIALQCRRDTCLLTSLSILLRDDVDIGEETKTERDDSLGVSRVSPFKRSITPIFPSCPMGSNSPADPGMISPFFQFWRDFLLINQFLKLRGEVFIGVRPK